jgi:hypothetical protein
VSGSGFHVFKSSAGGASPVEQIYSVASTTYTRGDAVTVDPLAGVTGQANKVATGDKATHIVEAMITAANLVAPSPPAAGVAWGQQFTSTANCEPLLCIPLTGEKSIIKSYLTGDATPITNGLACQTNASLTTIIFPTTGNPGAANDFTGGIVYCVELEEQRLVTACSVGGGNYTCTVNAPFTQAPTTGNTVIAVPFSKGTPAVKFNTTGVAYQSLDVTVAGKTGGTNRIEDVVLGPGEGRASDMRGPYVLSSVASLG